jgi:hypothetical protein
MMDDEDRWLWCGHCHRPVKVLINRRSITLRCEGCEREMVYEASPPGGDKDGLPPFLAGGEKD